MFVPSKLSRACLALALLLSVCTLRVDAEPKGGKKTAGKADPAQQTPARTEEFSIGGATIRLGMSQAEVYAQVDANRDQVKWFEMDLDSEPTTELLKMDNWTLVYSEFDGANLRAGSLQLTFDVEKLIKIDNTNSN